MNKPKLIHVLLFVPVVLLAQTEESLLDDIDLSDVVVIEDAPAPGVESGTVPADPGAVEIDLVEPDAALDEATADIEVLDAPLDAAAVDVDILAPEIPAVTAALPSETEVVLELPGLDASADVATLVGENVPTGSATMTEEETISVDFPDEDVRTILRNVADLFDLNLVIPDTLQGRTSVKLRNITWRQVFEVVLEPLGFTYLEDRNIIRIKSIAELTTEPVDTRIFIVNYARANELQASIAPLVDAAAGGRIQVDGRSNALVITERPSRMNKIQEIIERLDKATDQIMIETKFIEVSNSDVKDLGVNWASLSGYGVGVGNIQREWSRSRTSSRSNEGSSGSGLSSSVSTTSGNSNSVEDSSSTLSNLAQIASAASTGRFDTAVFSADNFRVVLSALKQMRNSKLKTNPTIVVMDNKQAYLNIGQQYPTREFEYNPETGQIEPGALNYQPLGVELTVTPSANADGMINLDIEPKVRVLAGTIATLNGLEDPLFEEKSVQTSVTIKDGFTLALGGLVEQVSSDQSTAVPLLSKLPGLGRLFKSKSTNVETNNLIIFITAKTLNPDGSTYRDVVDPRVLDQMEILPSELPGYQVDQAAQAQLKQLEAYRIQSNRDEASALRQARIKGIEKKQRKDSQSKAQTEEAKTEVAN
jgi:type IV pilus assembly protein PilQ